MWCARHAAGAPGPDRPGGDPERSAPGGAREARAYGPPKRCSWAPSVHKAGDRELWIPKGPPRGVNARSTISRARLALTPGSRRSEVSRIRGELDEQVSAFRDRSLGHSGCPRICAWTPPTKGPRRPTRRLHCGGDRYRRARRRRPRGARARRRRPQGRRLLDRLPAQPAGPGPGVAVTAHLGKDEVFNHALAAVVDASDREHAALKVAVAKGRITCDHGTLSTEPDPDWSTKWTSR